MISSANAAVITQFNSSLTEENLTATTTTNYTRYVNVPSNSTVSAAWVGLLKAYPLIITAQQDAAVVNFGCCRNNNYGTDYLEISYYEDTNEVRTYFSFSNITVNTSEYSDIELVVPYDSPGHPDAYGLNFNISVYEVLIPWSEGNITWNNQPCGTNNTPEKNTGCNLTPISRTNVTELMTDYPYECSDNRLMLNVTSLARRNQNNFSVMLRIDRNQSYSGLYAKVSPCSKETGDGLNQNGSFSTKPSLYFGRHLYPDNVSVWINNSVANQTMRALNESGFNFTINASQMTNLSKSFVTPLPITFQVGGPGIVELNYLAFIYSANTAIPILSFNNTAPYVVSWTGGSAIFIKEFVINNTGGADATNCSIQISEQAGGTLAPYLTYDAFNVSSQSSTSVNISVTSPPDGFYDNLINVMCQSGGLSESFFTQTPIDFVFSLTTPSASAGGGGGVTVVNEVTNVTVSFNPRLGELFYLSYPGSSKFEFTSFSNVILESCEAAPGFECQLTPQKTGVVLTSSIPHKAGGLSDKIRTNLIITGEAGQVGTIPVGITVLYVGFPALALAGIGLLGAVWVVKQGR